MSVTHPIQLKTLCKMLAVLCCRNTSALMPLVLKLTAPPAVPAQRPFKGCKQVQSIHWPYKSRQLHADVNHPWFPRKGKARFQLPFIQAVLFGSAFLCSQLVMCAICLVCDITQRKVHNSCSEADQSAERTMYRTEQRDGNSVQVLKGCIWCRS